MLFCSCARREYREGVPPGSGFFSCGIFVIRSALKATSNSGKEQEIYDTDLSVPLSTCGSYTYIPAMLYDFSQVTLLIGVFSLVLNHLFCLPPATGTYCGISLL